jgi:hypothetical protein
VELGLPAAVLGLAAVFKSSFKLSTIVELALALHAVVELTLAAGIDLALPLNRRRLALIV